MTAVRQLGADGGLSSYRLRIQPALALLAYRRTCRIFQEESVPDIVAQIVQEHRASNPPIAASFRLDQQLRQRRPRSCVLPCVLGRACRDHRPLVLRQPRFLQRGMPYGSHSFAHAKSCPRASARTPTG
ncbi:phage late control D family protein [Xanthomonas oryzae]|uniref:phage late control D family protein n=1 Tax=Xanthomonas oryzae TaxID=347 RepID=UPI002367BAC3|nr:phage late control D family protein [Xanthomonas oryzae]WDN09562.1 phage late control D family protein [Xanthomonas oryzae]